MAARIENNHLGILVTGHGAGLGILAQIYSHSHLDYSINTNIVLKSGLKSLTRTPLITNPSINLAFSTTSASSPATIRSSNYTNEADSYYNFKPKSCHSCSKPLRHDKDIFMYRGEQFCSEECRSRQIMADERREREAKLAKNKAVASFSAVDCRGCETCKLVEDLRQRRRRRQTDDKTISLSKRQPILSIS